MSLMGYRIVFFAIISLCLGRKKNCMGGNQDNREPLVRHALGCIATVLFSFDFLFGSMGECQAASVKKNIVFGGRFGA
jgi:hypothetical protein